MRELTDAGTFEETDYHPSDGSQVLSLQWVWVHKLNEQGEKVVRSELMVSGALRRRTCRQRIAFWCGSAEGIIVVLVLEE